MWVSPSLEISLIDFGSAKSFERPNMDHSHRLKADIVNLLRQFCRAFTDVDFARYDQAQKALEKNDFREVRYCGTLAAQLKVQGSVMSSVLCC